MHVYAVHPGLVGINLMRNLSDEDRTWLDRSIEKSGATYKTPQQGAATSEWAATAPELEGQGGLYLEDAVVSRGGRRMPSMRRRRDAVVVERRDGRPGVPRITLTDERANVR